MNVAKSFLSEESNLKKLKPCVEVLDYICKKTTTNIDGSSGIELNPTAIAEVFYKKKYIELQKQFETKTENMDRGSDDYKKLKGSFARKKKLAMQVISRKCITLVDLKLICENENPGLGSDKRNTYYYPTPLGSEVNNLINAKGFPIIDRVDKKSVQDMISDKESQQEIKNVQHSIKLRELINHIGVEFPMVQKFGIHTVRNGTSIIEYHGEQFNFEIEQPELYDDFFNIHLSVDKRLFKKIAVFKHQSNEFWINKREIFEEMELDLNKYFHSEISESRDFQPLDEKILDWIYLGATYLARNKKGAFKEYFTNVNLKTRIIYGDWFGQKKNNDVFSSKDVLEYSVGSYSFLRASILDDENYKSHLEKKLGDYMKNLPHWRYYKDLNKNIELLQVMFALRKEIITILKKESLKTHFPGKCKFIK
ncbi:MAG: hypothetical protein KAJ51_01745 [Thermoplasmata archaeon]|nr:hypothetical protein [Thermoplasmata archaeon]